MDEDERIKQFCRAYASAMLHLDAAKAMPAIGGMLAQQARQELEKGCKLFPETVRAKVRKLYEHAVVAREEREADSGECQYGSSTIRS
jgi:hypothetical protein